MPSTSANRLLLLPFAGFAAWSVAFVALYGLLSIGCELGWQQLKIGPANLHRVVLIATWIASIAINGWIMLASWRGMRAPMREGESVQRLLWWMATLANIGAFVSMIWIGLPILGSSLCL